MFDAANFTKDKLQILNKLYYSEQWLNDLYTKTKDSTKQQVSKLREFFPLTVFFTATESHKLLILFSVETV